MITREDLVAEARSWLGTPFVDCADVKGVGVDCAMILVRVCCDLGLAPPIDPRPYKPQQHLYQGYLDWLARYAKQVDEPQPGDIEMFKIGEHAFHSAFIIVPGATILHAYKPSGRVILDEPRRYRRWHHSYWSAFV